MTKDIYAHMICLLFAISAATKLQAQNVLKIQTGATLSCIGGAIITLTDMDFENDGIVNHGIGQSAFVFNGTANNTILGTSSPLFDRLHLAKTGSGKVTLQRSIQIGSAITFGTGILDLNAQNVFLETTASLLGESETSHITGINGGYVQIVTALIAPSVAHPGNLGVEISSTRDLGLVTIRRGHQSQKNAFGFGNTIFRYYDIVPDNNTALNARLRFNYLDAELNGLNENALTLFTSSDNRNWANVGFVARNSTSNYAEQENLNSFHRFTLSEANNPLPLIWGSLNTQCISGKTLITWKTLQEQNTAVFVIRRSMNGNDWTNIGSLPAAGNSQTTQSYSYTDPLTLDGTTYYQIAQQDLDGRQTYSPVLTSKCAQPEHIKVYPNPAQNNCWVSIQSERGHTISMHLYNPQGALLQQQVVKISRGNNVLALSLTNYPKGVYSLVCTWSDGKVKVIKVNKQ